MADGRECAKCGHHLRDKEFKSYGSWDYTCRECGFKYNHSSYLSEDEQVVKYDKEQTEKEDAEDKADEQKYSGNAVHFSELKNLTGFNVILMGLSESNEEVEKQFTKMLVDSKVVHTNTINAFTGSYLITGNIRGKDSRTDYLFKFKKDIDVNIGRLAIVRLQINGMKWVEDFIDNYKSDYGESAHNSKTSIFGLNNEDDDENPRYMRD